MIRVGVDLGERFVGLAIHDDPELPARPRGAVDLKGARDAVTAVAAALKEMNAEQAVVGLPLNLDGREGPKAKAARRFADALSKRCKLPVVLWDERLTTAQAQRNRVERGARGRQGIDAEAAAILLQSYVDAQSGGGGWPSDDDP